METLSGVESDQGWDDLFIAVEGGSRSGEGGQQQWCGLNALVLTWEGRWREGTLPKDEAEAASSSWLNGNVVW
jgi:hypothetical protein